MAVVTGPVHERRRVPWSRLGLVGLGAVVGVVVTATVVALARSDGGDTTQGSGVAVTESRELAPFAAIELAGESTLSVRVGPAQSVAVSADDNLVDNVTTTVRGDSLVIDSRGRFTTEAPMDVTVSVPSLTGVTLSGTGTVIVDGVTGADVTAVLSGAGTLIVSGGADRVTAALTGVGTLDLAGLAAQDVTARLEGAGDVSVHATSTLDATLTGTGEIVYTGSPAVTTHTTGVGSITPA
jgi:Putative auto-transporter adhesin, head GIN domain